MRILVLAPHPFYVDRGTPMDVDLLLRALSARGETVDVLTYHEGEEVHYPNVSLHRVSAPWWLRNIRPGFSFRKILCDVLMFFQAWRLMARGKYDVIHAGEEAVFMAMLFKVFYRVPYIYDMDSSIAQQIVEKMGFLRPLAGFFNWCEALAIRNSLAVAPVCHALADLARQRGAANVVTLHDISQLVDADFVPGHVLRETMKINGVIGMYVGNLETYQGIDLLLESFPIARKQGANVQLVIAGGKTGDVEKYRRKAESLGVGQYVHFIGPWPARKLGRLLAEADFLVAPRIKGVNTPMKIFPYLHSGRPVLATDLPTHTQVLDDSVAMLATAEPKGFASAMFSLAEDRYLRARLGAAGKRFVEENHTYGEYQRRLNRLYDQVCAMCNEHLRKHDRYGSAAD